MSIELLTKAIKVLPPKKAIMLVGPAGVGKTVWSSTELPLILGIDPGRVVFFYPAHADGPGDITGYPMRYQTEHGDWITKNCPPAWMKHDSPVLLIIDEANRGFDSVMNAMMQLTNDQTYDNIHLPEGSRIVACINPEEGDYLVAHMDLAQRRRFAMFEFAPTTDETLAYFARKNKNKKVLAYLKDNPIMLDFNHYEAKELMDAALKTGLGVVPSCAAWENVADTVDNAEAAHYLENKEDKAALILAIEGLVGTENAAAISDYLVPGKSVMSPSEIMLAEVFEPEWHEFFKNMDAPSATLFFESLNAWASGLKMSDDKIRNTFAANLYQALKNLKPDILSNLNISLFLKNAAAGGWCQTLICANAQIAQLLASTATVSTYK